MVDAHHHFWDPARREYPWLGDELATIRRPFGPEDLRPLLAATGVDRTVLVQTISSLDETRQFLATAAATDFIAGVVGWVDLMDPAVGDTLAELRKGPGGSFLVGIRHQVHDEPDPNWLLRPAVQRGIRAVGDAGLVYDLLVRTRELPAALEMVRSVPRVRFVIDHLAKPEIVAGPRDPAWEHAMVPFADCENVSCKLSGMVTEAGWTDWMPDDLRPYVQRALEWFGPERCIFGSDWPVCLLAATYADVIDALKDALGVMDVAGRDALFGGNAISVYRLTV
ncbi:MAG TPA: amidohydrolase family protein [Candidatus Dormibacteraeota bacterium]|nr:amidohydrolase family protein [Candidatus Dormibacteraeota bacterium]